MYMKLFKYVLNYCMHSSVILILYVIIIPNSLSYGQIKGWSIVNQVDGKHSVSGHLKDAVAIDLDLEGNIYIVDRMRHRILKYSQKGSFLKEVGGFGDGPEQFNDPRDINAHSALNIFVSDYNNNRIVRLDANLNYLNEFKGKIDNVLLFEAPVSVGLSGQYDIFILDDLNHRISKFDRFNQPLAEFGNAADNLGQLLNPYQLAISDKGRIFVSDPAKNAVIAFDYFGNFLWELDHPEFRQLAGISTTAKDLLVVSDTESQRIFLFKNNRQILENIDLRIMDWRPLDAAVFHSKGTGKSYLYILTPKVCYVLKRILE